MKKVKTQTPITFTPRVRANHSMHTCIEVARADGLVKYIPLDILRFQLLELKALDFDAEYYRQLADYPVSRAATLYAGYAADLGGTLEAMQELAKLTTITPKEIEMATKKAATAAAKTPATKKAAPKASKTDKAARPRPTAKKEPGERKPSAASMFKELIMAGGKTDDQIFAAVQKAFGLDDNKRSYVAWYRNNLVKQGEKPPAAKA